MNHTFRIEIVEESTQIVVNEFWWIGTGEEYRHKRRVFEENIPHMKVRIKDIY